MDDGAQAEVQGLTWLAMAFTPLRTEARARKPEAHKRRTTAALGDTKGTHECPRSAQWPQTAPQHAYRGADKSVNGPRWAGRGQGGTLCPQTACAAHADGVGAHPGGCRGPQARLVDGRGGQKTAGTRTPAPRE